MYNNFVVEKNKILQILRTIHKKKCMFCTGVPSKNYILAQKKRKKKMSGKDCCKE